MSGSEHFSRRPLTCARSHTHPHSQAHNCHRQAAKDHSQKHPPPGSVSLRICVTHTHTHTHTHRERVMRQVEIHYSAVQTVCCGSKSSLITPQAAETVPFTRGCWDRILPLKQKHAALRATGLGVDRLLAPILSILPIIDIGHFKNRFGDNCFFLLCKQTYYLPVTLFIGE